MIKKSIIYSIVILLSVITGSILSAQDNKKSNSNLQKNHPIPLAAFKHRDIGNPSIAGTVKVLNNGFDVIAGGADIWGVKDEFNFVYVERTGNFDLISRIESLMAANLYTKAGLMAREDLTSGCRHIYFQVFSDNNPEFPVVYPNVWIRLQRINNDFTGYYSTDGKTWKIYTTYNLVLPSKIYVGLAVTAHNTSHNASAKFRNIEELKN
jgi:hypothetical protein